MPNANENEYYNLPTIPKCLYINMIQNYFWYVIERITEEEMNDFGLNYAIITLSIDHYFPGFI